MPDGNQLRVPGVTPVTYQLMIRLHEGARIRVGRLGKFDFTAGCYVYTGSARRNLESRIARHLRREKKLRWHIDYLLNHPAAEVTDVRVFTAPECRVNQQAPGIIPVPGFGASDCRRGCKSHLKYIP